MTDSQPADEDEVKSKSQVKREMHALQELGKELVLLPDDQFNRIILGDILKTAVLEAKRINKHGAYKRQLQYIGRLLRNEDSDEIRQQLATIQGQSRQATQALHRVERWRERLLNEGDSALEILLQEYPHADRQVLRQFVRGAITEAQENRPPKSSRGLFRYLRDLFESDA